MGYLKTAISLVSIFLSVISFGQNIRFSVKLYKAPTDILEDKLVVGVYNGNDFEDVLKIDIPNDTVVSIDVVLKPEFQKGLYHIYIEDKREKETNKAELILSPFENPLIDARYFELKNGSIGITGSPENQAYGDLIALKEYYEPQLFKLVDQRRSMSYLIPDFKKYSTEIELQTELLQIKYDQELSSLLTLYPKTFTSEILVPLTMIPVRSTKEEWASKYDSYFSFLHDNYFAYINFNDPSNLRHYDFTDKIVRYFNDYTIKSEEGAMKAIDKIMEFRGSNEEVNTYLFNYLLKTFIKLENEPLTKYLYNTYSSSCSLDLPFEELKKLETMQALSVGGQVPEISLPDVKGKYHSLRAYCSDNKYTILFVWLSWCSRCQKELPEVNKLYQQYKSKGLGVFTVSLDEKTTEWQSKFDLINKNWVNVAELVAIPNSTVVKNFNISTTPLLIVLDDQGKVVAKGIFGQQLENFLGENFK